MKYIIPLILSAFFITACDQKTDPNQVDCNKAVSKMTDQEKTQCGKSGDSAGLLDDILNRFANVASNWAGTIQNYATWIFWSLAVISMVWTFAMMAMQGEGLSAALAEVVRFFAVLGFF